MKQKQWNMRRMGEWAEFQLAAPFSDQPRIWLQQILRIPPKFLEKLEKEDGLQISGNKIRLRLFPKENAQFPAEWHPLDVLYEDDFCLVVNKPPGMKVHPTKPHERGTLANAVSFHYLSSGATSAIRHIHRLDQDTSGPVLYAKNEFSHRLLDEAMRQKQIVREYVAFVHGRIEKNRETLKFPIGRDRHHPVRRRVSPTGQSAVTHMEVLERFENATLVRLRLETGRTHQIRVHLSHIGHPLIGDVLYGGKDQWIKRQALHGSELFFPHPLGQTMIRVCAPWPEDLQRLKDLLHSV